jgi:hypothetical protein
LFFAVGIVAYCRVVVLGGLGLFAFQISNVPRSLQAESRNLRQTKSRTEKK